MAQTYLVGGAVRDSLLGLAVKDKDWVVVGSTSKSMLEQGFTQVGKDFPVFLHPATKEEYALARTEKKQGKGYTGFACYSEPDVSLEEDLIRRDLTINAMAQNSEGQIIDPFNGQVDLKDKYLRHVSDAFIEDPLRVLRVARFAARYASKNFTVHPSTLHLMTHISQSGELENLSAERIFLEMEKALSEDHAYVFFEVLKNCGALAAIFPELDCLWGIPNPEQWHPEIDTGIHTMLVLQQACKLSTNTSTRFAALCHDLGKGVTPKDKWPSHHGHEKLGVPIIEALAKRLKIPNQSKELACLVSEFHLHLHKAYDLQSKTILRLFNRCDAWRKPLRFEELLKCCEADFRGRTGFELRPYPQINYIKSCLNAATQVDVQNIIAAGIQGKHIKEALAQERIKAISQIKKAAANNS